MNTTIYQQPFALDGTPQTMGQFLARQLNSGPYNRFKFSVAFVTSSGTSRLFGPLCAFIQSGGKVEAHIGLANNLTSLQAVEHLLLAGAEVWGFDTGSSILFHPKVYLLIGAHRAWVAVGSSNITSQGLYRNFETSSATEFDLNDATDVQEFEAVRDWFTQLIAYTGNCTKVTSALLPGMVANGSLVDERVKPEVEIVRSTGSHTTGTSGSPRIKIPSAPPPHPSLRGARTRVRQLGTSGNAPTAIAPLSAQNSQFFAMTLSAFDCSHRTGVPGTPEMSLPEDIVKFFPPVSMKGRKYPDAYFDVLLNAPSGSGQVVSFRLWQRPPGSGTGHADWRINVKHETIDLTDPAGRDILLIEKLPQGSNPPYQAWIVATTQPTYGALLARCTSQVQASSTAGTKHYGLF